MMLLYCTCTRCGGDDDSLCENALMPIKVDGVRQAASLPDGMTSLIIVAALFFIFTVALYVFSTDLDAPAIKDARSIILNQPDTKPSVKSVSYRETKLDKR